MNASPHSRHRSHSAHTQRLVALAGAIACLLVIALCTGCSAAPSESTGSHGNPFANTINDASSEHGSADGDGQTESAPEEDPLTVRTNEIIDGMTLEQKAAQLFVVTPEAITDVDTATLATEATRAALEAYPVGGIVYSQKNLVNERYAPSEAAVAALEAGVDMVLMPADLASAYQGVLDAVASGRLSEERIDDSLERIVRTKLAWEDGSLGA